MKLTKIEMLLTLMNINYNSHLSIKFIPRNLSTKNKEEGNACIILESKLIVHLDRRAEL